MPKRKSVIQFIVSLLSVFGVIWLLLEPLGGFIYLISIKNQIIIYYIILLILSILISLILLLLKVEFNKTDDPLIEIGENRSNYNYLNSLNNAQIQVDLLGLSLAPYSTEEYVNTLEKLIERGVLIRIILLNPLSPNIKQRQKDLYSINTDIRIATATTLKTLVQLKKCISARRKNFFLLKVINVLPNYGMFKVDKEILWNPYLAKKTGLGSPFLVVKEESIFGKNLIIDFNVLWNEFSYEVNETTNLEDLKEFLQKDDLIYEMYNDENTINLVKPFYQ